jgi:hypothetical protein
MPVHRIVAKIRFAAHEPLRERRLVEITNCMERFPPVNRFSLFGPEAFAFFQSATTEIERSGWLSHGGVDQVSSEIAGKQCRSVDRSCLLAAVQLGSVYRDGQGGSPGVRQCLPVVPKGRGRPRFKMAQTTCKTANIAPKPNPKRTKTSRARPKFQPSSVDLRMTRQAQRRKSAEIPKVIIGLANSHRQKSVRLVSIAGNHSELNRRQRSPKNC